MTTTNPTTQTPFTGRVKYLVDLRQRHNLPIDDVLTMDWKKQSDEIERLKALPIPPSPAQWERIHSMLDEMRSAGVKISISQEKLNSLTGGREGTASKFMDYLMGKMRELSPDLPPTDKQLDILMDWYKCPSIPWENISLSVEVEPAKYYPNGDVQSEAKFMSDTLSINFKKPLETGGWERMTDDEFREELKSKLTRSTTSRFIDAYRADYYEWKKSRATKDQINEIQTLEKRLANSLNGVKEEVFYMNEAGEVEYLEDARVDHSMTVVAYSPTPIEVLETFGVRDATRLIDQLRSEIKVAHKSDEVLEAQMWLEEKVQNFKSLIDASPEQKIAYIEDKKMEEISNAIHGFSSAMGRDLTEFAEHESLSILVRGGGSGAVRRLKDALVAEMVDCMMWDNRDVAWSQMGKIGSFFQEIEELNDVYLDFSITAMNMLKDIDKGVKSRKEEKGA